MLEFKDFGVEIWGRSKTNENSLLYLTPTIDQGKYTRPQNENEIRDKNDYIRAFDVSEKFISLLYQVYRSFEI